MAWQEDLRLDGGRKREEQVSGDNKVLEPKRDPYDGDTEEEAQGPVQHHERDPKRKPQHAHKPNSTPRPSLLKDRLFSKRSQDVALEERERERERERETIR